VAWEGKAAPSPPWIPACWLKDFITLKLLDPPVATSSTKTKQMYLKLANIIRENTNLKSGIHMFGAPLVNLF